MSPLLALLVILGSDCDVWAILAIKSLSPRAAVDGGSNEQSERVCGQYFDVSHRISTSRVLGFVSIAVL